MANKPRWANPDRQLRLVELFLDSGGFCVHGHKPCQWPQKHHYTPYSEGLIKDWIADDRAQSQAELKAEQRALHGLYDRGRALCQFDAETFFAEQPSYYFEGLGISGLTFKPFAKVRLASSYVCLFVDLGDTLRKVSKNKRRKAIRYGKALPKPVKDRIEVLCWQAVKQSKGN